MHNNGKTTDGNEWEAKGPTRKPFTPTFDGVFGWCVVDVVVGGIMFLPGIASPPPPRLWKS